MAEGDIVVIPHVRKNETGEVRIYEAGEDFSVEIDDDSPFDPFYVWREGNWSCDCNRRLFWYRAVGDEWEGDDKCSDGKFSVNLYDKEGKCLYKEFDE